MLRTTSELKGLTIHATDGNIGSVDNVYFDDERWHVRYFVVDTGRWLPGRLVLIAPAAIAEAHVAAGQLNANLTRDQVEGSPGIESHETVSRRHELHMSKYYGWPVYWPAEMTMQYENDAVQGADSHLRSASEVRGYYVHARDGDIGHVDDLLIDDESWEIRYLVIDTRNWWPGKRVLIDPRATEEIDWARSTFRVKLSQAEIKNSPEFDPSGGRESHDKAHLADYKHWPTYWY